MDEAVKIIADPNIKNVEKRVVFKRGSFMQEIIFITNNPTIAVAAGNMVVELLKHYRSNKNTENREFRHHKAIVNPIVAKGDNVQVTQISGGNNNIFFLDHEKKDKYLSNLEPKQKSDRIVREQLIGRFRKFDLDQSKNKFGFTPDSRKRVPATITGIDNPVSILPDIMDKDLRVDANVVYEGGKMVSIEVLKYELVNRPLDLDDASA